MLWATTGVLTMGRHMVYRNSEKPYHLDHGVAAVYLWDMVNQPNQLSFLSLVLLLSDKVVGTL